MDKRRTSIDVSVVVPVYNSESTIAELVDQMTAELESKYNFEFVLVDDGSSDGSGGVCRTLALANPRLKFLSLSQNFGQSNAIMAGFRESAGRVVVVLDDDLQNPPREVHKLLDKVAGGWDFVYGAPQPALRQSLSRRLFSRMSARVAEMVFDKPKGLYASSYFALKREVVREIVRYEGPYPYITGLVLRATRRGVNVPVEHHARRHGGSGYSFGKLFMLWLRGLTNFSILPLRVSSLLGAVSASFGFLYTTFIIVRKLLRPEMVSSGWSSIAALVLIFAGVQLMALGMLGEYVGRIFMLLSRTPQFVVREKLNCDE